MKKRWMALLLVIALLLAGCGSGGENQTEENGQVVYLLARPEQAGSLDRLQPVNVSLPAGDAQEQAAAALQVLLQGAPGDDLLSPLPEGTQVLSVEVRNKHAFVDFSGEFSRLNGIELTMADYCVALSLTAIEGILSVSITAQGRTLAQQPKAMFYERDVLLSTMDDVVQRVPVTLYFADSAGALAGEKRMLELYEGQTLAENLLYALMEGPESRDLTALLSPDFVIHSARVEEGTCYVNLSGAALDTLPQDEARQQLILWSLAESLCSITAVVEVRLLADGEELTAFGQIPLDGPLEQPQG